MAESRTTLIDAFLASAGWGKGVREPLAGDASFRRYERVLDGDKRAVLMDAPSPEEDVRPFIAIARHLLGLGYAPPRILAEDVEAGLLLLEDLGDATYTRVLADAGEREPALYALAVDVLADLHRKPASRAIPAGLPAYDEARLIGEAELLVEWFLPAIGRPADDDQRATYASAWRAVLGPLLTAPPTLVLRDYHVDNLIWLDRRSGVAACGLLDFQDAVAGHPAYDLMSLLEDARRDIGEALRETMLERYFAASPALVRPGPARAAFIAAFAVLGAQRHAKVIGIFTRLCIRDAKPDYLVHIPRLWRLLERSLAAPTLAPVADWFDRHVPHEARGVPPCPAAEK